MTTQDYALELRNVLDYARYSRLVASLGNSLNDRKDRFDKSDIIEQSIDVYSDGRLVWVDDIGRDHRDSIRDLDLEFKFANNSIFTATGNKKKLVKVKLKNSLGKNKGTTVEHPADYYMIGQADAIGIISWEDISPYLVAVPDGIEAHVPFDKLELIFSPIDVMLTEAKDVDYKERKAKMQRALIESV